MRDATLKCMEDGSGPPLVLLHAFPLSRRMWDKQVDAWKRSFRVIAPDLRGFGESPVGSGEMTMEFCADDLNALFNQLGVQEKAVLLGLSMGVYVAFEFVRKYQERLCALVLAATQPVADSEESKKARFETAQFVKDQGPEKLADRLIPRLLGKTTLDSRPAVVEKVRNLIQSNSTEGIAQACYGLASRRDSTPVLDQIRIPTLILAGAEDVIVSKIQSENMHQSIRSSRLRIIESSGHLINLEQPELFNQAVLDFLHETL